MKKTRRILALVLCLVMTMSLVACGGSGAKNTPDAPDNKGGNNATISNEGREVEIGTVGDKHASVIGANGGTTTGDMKTGDELANAVSTEDTLVIRIDGDPSTFDNIMAVSNAMLIQGFIQNTLLTTSYNEDMIAETTLNDKYGLAESFTIDEDNMGLTWKLREGVKWHNGDVLTTDDVLFSIERYRTMSRYDYIDFDNVTKISDTEFHVGLTRTDPSSVYGVGAFQIVNKKVFEEVGEENYFTTPAFVGTGPYKITQWITGDSITLERFDDYFGGVAKIKNVKFRFISEAAVAMMELETGGVHVIDNPNWTDCQNIDNGMLEGVAKYYKCLDRFDNYLGFNLSEGSPFADLRVRQAVCYAIDRDELLIGAYEGLCSETYTMWTGDGEYLINWDKESWPYNTNLEKAKELMADAGYADGFSTKLMTNQKADQGLAIQIIKNQLAKIGIDCELVTYDSATYSSLMANDPTSFGLWLRNWTAGTVWYTGITNTMKTNCHPQADDPTWQKYEALAYKIGETMDNTEREQLWHELQEGFMEEALYMYHLNKATKNTLVVDNLYNLERCGYTFFPLDAHFG